MTLIYSWILKSIYFLYSKCSNHILNPYSPVSHKICLKVIILDITMHVKYVASTFLAKRKILQLKRLRKCIIAIMDIVLCVSKINFNREKITYILKMLTSLIMCMYNFLGLHTKKAFQHLHTVGENINWCSCYRNSTEVPLKIELRYDPTIPFQLFIQRKQNHYLKIKSAAPYS